MNPCIRLYCLVLPTAESSASFQYLKAFHEIGMEVKACPIGPAFITGGWMELVDLFMAKMPGEKYVNVVIAHPELVLGLAANIGNDVVYDPTTAFAGLHTEGVPNIAVVHSTFSAPSTREIKALLKYDFVLAPTAEDTEILKDLGVPALHVPAEAGPLGLIVSALLS